MLNSLGGPSAKVCSSAKFCVLYSREISPVRLAISYCHLGVFWGCFGGVKGGYI